MIEVLDRKQLIDLVIDKHRRFLEEFDGELSELNSRLDTVKAQYDEIKKEIAALESKILVLTEKYHLLYHQAKKQREELFAQVMDKLKTIKAQNTQDIVHMDRRIGELEKKLQTSKNIEDEKITIAEITAILHDFESAVRSAGIIISCDGIIDKLNEAITSHIELLSLQDRPEEQGVSVSDCDKQINEIKGRQTWLKHRIESHSNALAYWEQQKEGIQIERTG